MASYKKQIEDSLSKHNWEIIEIGSNLKWWDDEHWKIKYRYDNSSPYYFICFLVDPQFEPDGKNSQSVWEVQVTRSFPDSFSGSKNPIASICMNKGNFGTKLEKFIIDLERYREGIGKAL